MCTMQIKLPVHYLNPPTVSLSDKGCSYTANSILEVRAETLA